MLYFIVDHISTCMNVQHKMIYKVAPISTEKIIQMQGLFSVKQPIL
jgi:hypothetical protein